MYAGRTYADCAETWTVFLIHQMPIFTISYVDNDMMSYYVLIDTIVRLRMILSHNTLWDAIDCVWISFDTCCSPGARAHSTHLTLSFFFFQTYSKDTYNNCTSVWWKFVSWPVKSVRVFCTTPPPSPPPLAFMIVGVLAFRWPLRSLAPSLSHSSYEMFKNNYQRRCILIQTVQLLPFHAKGVLNLNFIDEGNLRP